MDPDQQLAQCVTSLKQKNYELAIAQLSLLLDVLQNCSETQIKDARLKMGLTAVPATGGSSSSSQQQQQPLLVHPKLATAYDLRLKAYLKTNNVSKAYHDAKQIVKSQPFGAKGYLRCGSILEMTKNYSKAHQVYTNGLATVQRAAREKNIKVAEGLIEQLVRLQRLVELKLEQQQKQQQQKPGERKRTGTTIDSILLPAVPSKKQQRQLPAAAAAALPAAALPQKIRARATFQNPIIREIHSRHSKRKSADPVQRFPIEIVTLIFSHFHHSQIIGVFFLVSKLWHRTLSQISTFYQRFTFAQTPLVARTFNHFLAFIKHAKQNSRLKSIQDLKIAKIAAGNERYVVRKLVSNELRLRVSQVSLNLFELDLFQFVEMLECATANNNDSSSTSSSAILAIQDLNLSIATTPFLEEKLLHCLPRLRHLKLVFINGHNNQADMCIELKDFYKLKVLDFYQLCCSSSSSSSSTHGQAFFYQNLKSLTLIGNRKLQYSQKKIPFNNIFKYSRVPNLEKLVIVGFNFKNIIKSAEEVDELQQQQQQQQLLDSRVSHEHASTFKGIFKLPKLTELHLENNHGLTIQHFLHHRQDLNNNNNNNNNNSLVSAKLEKLTLRQDDSNDANSQTPLLLDSPTSHSLLAHQFGSLAALDLFGTTLTFTGLMKILSHVGPQLRVLNIGNARYFEFPQNRVHLVNNSGAGAGAGAATANNDNFFNFHEFIQSVPNLAELYIPQCSSFNDFTLSVLKAAILQVQQAQAQAQAAASTTASTTASSDVFWHNLKILDLSFATLSGFGILEFFNYRMKTKQVQVASSMASKARSILLRAQQTKRQTLSSDSDNKHQQQQRPLKLNKLIINGIENVSQSTLGVLVDEGYVEDIENTPLLRQ